RVQEILKNLPADAPRLSARRRRSDDTRQKHLTERHEMWERGEPISEDDVVGRYLLRRVGFIPDAPEALRRLPDKCTTWMMARATHLSAWGTLHYTDMNLEALPRRRSHKGFRPPGSAVQLMPIG